LFLCDKCRFFCSCTNIRKLAPFSEKIFCCYNKLYLIRIKRNNENKFEREIIIMNELKDLPNIINVCNYEHIFS